MTPKAGAWLVAVGLATITLTASVWPLPGAALNDAPTPQPLPDPQAFAADADHDAGPTLLIVDRSNNGICWGTSPERVATTWRGRSMWIHPLCDIDDGVIGVDANHDGRLEPLDEFQADTALSAPSAAAMLWTDTDANGIAASAEVTTLEMTSLELGDVGRVSKNRDRIAGAAIVREGRVQLTAGGTWCRVVLLRVLFARD